MLVQFHQFFTGRDEHKKWLKKPPPSIYIYIYKFIQCINLFIYTSYLDIPIYLCIYSTSKLKTMTLLGHFKKYVFGKKTPLLDTWWFTCRNVGLMICIISLVYQRINPIPVMVESCSCNACGINWLAQLSKEQSICDGDMGVSGNSGTPQIIHFNRVFHYKPSILGYPYFRKHPYKSS